MPLYASILIGVAAALALFVLFVATRKGDVRITRSATMAASPHAVFAQVNDFHNWDAWSPWAKIDPNAKVAFDGPPAGVGAVYTWDGNNKVGAGRMTLTESEPVKLVRINLEFFRPMKCTNLTEFTFTPDGGSTVVTWTMTGKNGFMGKLFCLFMNIDKMVGKDFEKGLASIKGIVEGGNPSRAAA